MILFNHATKISIRQRQLGERRHQLDTSGQVQLVPPDDETYESPIAARTVPFLFFNVLRSGDDFDTANWVGVSRVNLETGDIATVLDVSDLASLARGRHNAFVDSLIRVSDDGAVLTVLVVAPVLIGNVLERTLYDVDLTSKSLTKLSTL